jgi:hypothetical protein
MGQKMIIGFAQTVKVKGGGKEEKMRDMVKQTCANELPVGPLRTAKQWINAARSGAAVSLACKSFFLWTSD